VPLKDGSIADDSRIKVVLPTIRHILENNGKLIVASHLDRPKGKVVPGLSLAPVSERLSKLLGTNVGLVGQVGGSSAEEAVGNLAPGSAIMLENLRFDPREEENDDEFCRTLASYADVYVDDAFANAHRRHASNYGVTQYFAEKCGGLLMKKELEMLSEAMESFRRPLVVIMGGAKISTKVEALRNLSKKADRLLVGGAMALPFLQAEGLDIGNYKVEEGAAAQARSILESIERDKIVLPVDFMAAPSKNEGANARIVPATGIPSDEQALDIGPATIDRFVSELKGAATIVWNGPLGVCEVEPFDRGTLSIAQAIADRPAFTLVGGGDTASVLDRYGLTGRISYVSTGGGAFLEMLSGRELPAITALEEVVKA